MKPDEHVAIENCDREPVHIPGRIQAFGAMLAFDIESGLVHYHSENLGPDYLGGETNLLGRGYEELIEPRPIIHAIRGALNLPTISTQRDRTGVFELHGKSLDFAIYSTGKTAVVELEPADNNRSTAQSSVSVVRGIISTLRKGEGLQPLLESCVKALRHLTGHDRVMAYQFLPNSDGEVVAEAVGVGIDPYLGLRYPASDIPTQVRQIMLRAPFRLIHNINAEHVALVQSPDSVPLDMTFSQLRGVSPIHLEYLANMGVQATMNVSIIIRGRLWGLFAFHHYRARQLSPDERSICELFGQLASMLIQQELEQERLNRLEESRSTLAAIASHGPGLEETVDAMAGDFRRLMKSDGLVLLGGDGALKYGTVPTDQALAKLRELPKEPIAAVQSMRSIPELADAVNGLNNSAGVLMLKLSASHQLFFFRNEVVHTIRWAGGKEKQIEYGRNGPRLTPRASFAEYCESVSSQSDEFTESDFALAGQIAQQLASQIHDGSPNRMVEHQNQVRYRDLLIAELNHRVRNTLALVRSIARQTHSKSESLETYVEALERRLAALSTAHDLIGGSGLQWARIDDMVRSELKPYKVNGIAIKIDGPPLAIRGDVSPILALLIHEMTTNAVKHGALSQKGGALSVTWKDHSGGVEICWLETVNDMISPPKRRGFGLNLIERAIPFQCNGRSSIDFGENDLTITFWLPGNAAERVSADSPVVTAKRDYLPGADESALRLDLIGSALILEDNIVLAMEMERMLRSLGVESVDTVPTKELALSAIERTSYDAALLDVNLSDDQNSFAVAIRLKEKNTPVVFVSGYDSKYVMPPELKDAPRLVKPVNRIDLANAFQQA